MKSFAAILPLLYIHSVSNYCILNYPNEFTVQEFQSNWVSILSATDSCIIPMTNGITAYTATLQCNPLGDVAGVYLYIDGVRHDYGYNTNFPVTVGPGMHTVTATCYDTNHVESIPTMQIDFAGQPFSGITKLRAKVP